jgi:capsular exopolysaccharide synthesis family protein
MDTGAGDSFHTEIVLLKSDDVAIRALNSLTDEEFVAFSGSRRGSDPIPQVAQSLSPQQQLWIGKLQDVLTVKQIDGTQLITLTVKQRDPRLAAALVNQVVKAYTVQSFEDRAHSVTELREWLSAQMDELQTHVETAQRKLNDFEKANHVVGTVGASNTIADRLRFLSERLSSAQSDRIGKEAQMKAATGGSPAELAALFPSPKLNTLQAAQGTLYAQYAQLSTKFGANYPPLADITQQMQRIDSEIASEVQSVRERLNTDYAAASRAQDLMQSEYDNQIALAYKFDRNQAEYSALQGDVTSSKELYDTLRRKLQQATVDTEVSGLNTILVQEARVPLHAAGPRPIFILLGSLILGLFAGVVAAFISDAASDRVRGSSQIELELGMPVLAHLSGIFENSDERGRAQSSYGLRASSSKTAEAVRTLRNSLILTPQAKSILITSIRDGEGALQVAANLAIALSNSGARTLVVDTQLQNPVGQRKFEIEDGPGLGDYLSGRSAELHPVQPLPLSENLFLVMAGDAGAAASDLLASNDFHSLLLTWRKEFSYVVILGPPLLTDSVGALLASWVDTTVLAVRDGHARVRELKQTRDTLLRHNARIHGVVLNHLPPRVKQPANKAERHQEKRHEYATLAKQTQAAD